MKTTFDIPEALVRRLSRHEARLEQILEHGLHVVEEEAERTLEPESEPDADDGLPEAWQAALGTLVARRSAGRETPALTAEALVSYFHGELEPGERDALQERIAADPQAQRDYLDLVDFERETTTSLDEETEAAQALEVFRRRHSRKQPAPRRRWLGLTAALAIAAGGLLLLWGYLAPEPEAGPAIATVIPVSATRGARPFPISENAEEVLLVVPIEDEPAARHGEVRILAESGREVYRRKFRGEGDRWSRLYLTLRRENLPPGSYRVEITSSPSAGPETTRALRFAIEAPPPR